MKTLLTAAALVAGFAAGSATAGGQQPAANIRIGTYDNRAITVAYAASQFQIDAMAEKQAQLERGKSAGDDAKVAEAKQWGEDRQRQFHIQGFGAAVVGDLLKPVEKEMAELATRLNLVAITRECDFRASAVELVDVTDELVALYKPSPRTLQNVKAIRKAEPVPVGKLAVMDVHQ
jgi:hypothetical protein